MSTAGQVGSLARRSVIRTVRQPAAIVPALTFPLFFLALITGGATAASDIPGFPAPSYLDFALPAAAVQGALLGGINAGSELALDIENGFIRRLTMTPMQRPALLVGHLAGSMFVGLIQGTLFLAVGAIFGVEFQTGMVGSVVVVLLIIGVALAFSAVGALIAARTGSSETVQSVFPLFFIVMSFSSFFMPRDLINVDWFRYIANVNPASYIIEAGRGLIVAGWDAGQIATGFGAVAAISVLGIGAAASALRTRMART